MLKKLLVIILCFHWNNGFGQNWQDSIAILNDCNIISSSDDLVQIGNSIGSSRVVGLGETTHGTHEIFTMKHRLIKYLVEEKGFNIIAFESNKPETKLLNDYIQGGNGNPSELLKGLYFWTWNTKEILDLINWLRDYNSTKDEKVQFLGIDLQYNNQSTKNLKGFSYSNPEIVNLLEQIETMYENTKRSKLNYAELDTLIDALTKQIDAELASNLEVRNFEKSIREDLKIVYQSAHMDKTQSTVYRDENMALYVKDYLDEAVENKVIVWAHNMHISTDEFWKMGNHLRKWLKSDYYAIGFSLSRGTYTAKDYQNKIRTNHYLKENPKNSIEYQFDKVNIPLFFISTIALKKDKWFNKKRKFRDIGAALWGGEFTKIKINQAYDGLIFIKESSSSILLN